MSQGKQEHKNKDKTETAFQKGEKSMAHIDLGCENESRMGCGSAC